MITKNKLTINLSDVTLDFDVMAEFNFINDVIPTNGSNLES